MAKPTKHYGGWRIRWIDAAGQRHSEVYEDYDVAKRVLRDREHDVDQVKLGLRGAIVVHKTFGELCDYWLENRVPAKRSGDDDRSTIRAHLRPAFGELNLREISVAHVDRYLVSHAKLNIKTVHNHLTLFITMLNVALDLGWLERMPRIKKPRVRLINQDYRYLRTNEEIERFLRAAFVEGEAVYMFFAAAVYTGMRAGELAGLRWDDVNFERRLITVQRSYEGPTKAADVRYVPILDPLLPLLRAWRLKQRGTLVFTNETGTMYGESARVFQEVLHRVLKTAGFPEQQVGKKKVRYITFHCLRHSFASHWVMRGGDLFKLQKILGHKSVQMTMRYAHLAPEVFAGEYGRLGSVAAGRGGEVVPLQPTTTAAPESAAASF